MDCTSSDNDLYSDPGSLDPSPLSSAAPNTSRAGAVSGGYTNNQSASVPIPSESPARMLLEMPRRTFTRRTFTPAERTSLAEREARVSKSVFVEETGSREAAALALVGLTTAAVPPTHIAEDEASASNTTPRQAAVSASASAPASTTVVTPGSVPKAKPELTYAKGVGLVSDEISSSMTKAPGSKAALGSVSNPVSAHGVNNLGTLSADEWTTEETDRLIVGICRHGLRWKDICRHVGTRTAWQCRMKWEEPEGRWKEHLKEHLNEVVPPPTNKDREASAASRATTPPADQQSESNKELVAKDRNNTGDWNEDEINRLRKGIKCLDNNWTEIAEKHVKTRTSQQCKSKNQKMAKVDGGDWFTKAVVLKKKKSKAATKNSVFGKDDDTTNLDNATASSPPAFPQQQAEETESGRRRLSKRRPKRSVVEMMKEFEAKAELRQSVKKKEKHINTTSKRAKEGDSAATAKPLPFTSKKSTPPRSKTKKAVSAVSAKKPPSSKHMAGKGPKSDSRCSTPGCTRQRQGGCAGQCRKHYNQDRAAAGLDLAPTYVPKCKAKGCKKLKQYGFGDYCRLHYQEEQQDKTDAKPKRKKAAPKCSVTWCKKHPANDCDGMCGRHFNEQTANEKKKQNSTRTRYRTEEGNNMGEWDADETHRFLEGLRKHGTEWKKIAEHVRTRTAVQCKSKNQKIKKAAVRAAQGVLE